jgi:Ring finger domain
MKNDRPASEVVRDIVIIFFAGVAIIGSLVCATYLVTLLFDRFRGWFGLPPLEDGLAGPDGRRAGPVYSQPVHVGRLVHEAGLHGISKEQRMLLVQCILPPTPYDGKPFDRAAAAAAVTVTTTRSGSEGGGEGGKDVERAVVVCDVDSGVIQHDIEGGNDVDLEKEVPPVASDMDDIDYEHTCSICLAPYEVGSNLLRSRRCVHVFHWDCCQEWLQKRDVCPYCRTPMYTADDLRTAAAEILGPAAFDPLARASAVAIVAPPRPEEHEPAADPNHDADEEVARRSAAEPTAASPTPLETDSGTRRAEPERSSEAEAAIVALEQPRNEPHATQVGSA